MYENRRKGKVRARVTEQRLDLKRKGFSKGLLFTNLVSIVFSKVCLGKKFNWIFKQFFIENYMTIQFSGRF